MQFHPLATLREKIASGSRKSGRTAPLGRGLIGPDVLQLGRIPDIGSSRPRKKAPFHASVADDVDDRLSVQRGA